MKYSILALIITFISCNYKSKERIAYNEREFDSLWELDKTLPIKIIDTFCINETKRAKKELKHNKITYLSTFLYPEEKEMQKLLSLYYINYKFRPTSCFISPGFNPICYSKLMNEEIEKRYGKNFIDSLWKVSRKNFISNNPDFEYIENGEDIRKYYLKTN